jgi:hypothetical protein
MPSTVIYGCAGRHPRPGRRINIGRRGAGEGRSGFSTGASSWVNTYVGGGSIVDCSALVAQCLPARRTQHRAYYAVANMAMLGTTAWRRLFIGVYRRGGGGGLVYWGGAGMRAGRMVATYTATRLFLPCASRLGALPSDILPTHALNGAALF